ADLVLEDAADRLTVVAVRQRGAVPEVRAHGAELARVGELEAPHELRAGASRLHGPRVPGRVEGRTRRCAAPRGAVGRFDSDALPPCLRGRSRTHVGEPRRFAFLA